MSNYRIKLRKTDEGIGQQIAEDFGNPAQMIVNAESIEHVGDSADPALNVRISDTENVTIWLEDIDRIRPLTDGD